MLCRPLASHQKYRVAFWRRSQSAECGHSFYCEIPSCGRQACWGSFGCIYSHLQSVSISFLNGCWTSSSALSQLSISFARQTVSCLLASSSAPQPQLCAFERQRFGLRWPPLLCSFSFLSVATQLPQLGLSVLAAQLWPPFRAKLTVLFSYRN